MWGRGQAKDQDAWDSWETMDRETSEDTEFVPCPYTTMDSSLYDQGPCKTIKMSNRFDVFYNGPEMELEPAEGGDMRYQDVSKAFGIIYLDDVQATYVVLGLALFAGRCTPD